MGLKVMYSGCVADRLFMSENNHTLPNDTSAPQMPESNCTFDHVVKLGGGNLAILWLFIRLILGVSDNAVRYCFGFWGLILQLAFMHIFWLLNKERKDYLGRCAVKSDADVISVMLTWLFRLSIGGAILFTVVAIITSFVHGNGRSISLP
jgi:hypothetical protein